MNKQLERAHHFQRLHIKGNPLTLYNIWDPGSAKAIQEMGAKAVATSSWSVAAVYGFDDGEKIPFHLALANLQRIIANIHLPVTFDFEGGYGKSPDEVQENVTKVIAAGAVGINFEDQVVGEMKLYSTEDQSARISAIRNVAQYASIPLFINARTDIFLHGAEDHARHVDEAMSRAQAYADAGANGFFVPGLTDAKLIEKLCLISPIPINIMVLPETPSLKELADLGVARISYGPAPYLQIIAFLKEKYSQIHSATEHGNFELK